MKTILIILAIYVALDIITGIALYATLRLNGWNKWELARKFRDLLRLSADDFVENIADEVNDYYY